MGCNAGENIDDYWNVGGDRELSDTWNRFHKIHCITWKNTRWIYMVRERLTRKQTVSRPDTLWPNIWKDMSDASKRKEKQKWAIEKPKLDNARKFRGMYLIDLDDGEFKDIMKNARRKLEVPMPAAMPCKLQREKYRETCRKVEEHKTKIRLHC